MHLPSAGMIRFRFNGSAFASQPYGHPEVGGKIRDGEAGARGIVGACGAGGPGVSHPRTPVEYFSQDEAGR